MANIENLKARLADEPAYANKQALLDTGVAATIKVTVDELQAAIEACPNESCPICLTYLKASVDLPPNATLIVDKVDLDAVINGGKVVVDVELKNGRRYRTKRLEGAKPQPKPKAKPPKKSSEKPEGKP